MLVWKGAHPVVEFLHLGHLTPLRHVPRVDEDVPVRDREGSGVLRVLDLGVRVADAHKPNLRREGIIPSCYLRMMSR